MKVFRIAMFLFFVAWLCFGIAIMLNIRGAK